MQDMENPTTCGEKGGILGLAIPTSSTLQIVQTYRYVMLTNIGAGGIIKAICSRLCTEWQSSDERAEGPQPPDQHDRLRTG